MKDQLWLTIVQRVILLSSLCIFYLIIEGCATRQVEKVIIPDSHDLTPGYQCPTMETCVNDPDRVTIDIGYLREILETLDECRKQRI